jgi:hypothetical protein
MPPRSKAEITQVAVRLAYAQGAYPVFECMDGVQEVCAFDIKNSCSFAVVLGGVQRSLRKIDIFCDTGLAAEEAFASVRKLFFELGLTEASVRDAFGRAQSRHSKPYETVVVQSGAFELADWRNEKGELSVGIGCARR